MSKTKLLFQTPVNGAVLRTGTTTNLTQDRHNNDHHHHHHHRDRGIDVRKYESIRFSADNRAGSATAVTFNLYSTPKHGRPIRIARVRLAPGASYSNVYNVPGQWLTITATSASARSSSANGCGRRRRNVVDVAVYAR